jgi:elongation factor 1-beta
LFGSDDEEEDAEAECVKQERLKAYAEKKATKPKTIAKSLVTLDVKPWDDETDMKALETSVRSIEKDGLVWGSSTFVPVGPTPPPPAQPICFLGRLADFGVGFGIRKLQITLVVEDDKISLEELQEEIEEFEDYVQSTDIAAMAKL